MFYSSHETWMQSLQRHLNGWKKEGAGLSDTAMCDLIVQAHYRIGADVKTGIRFEPNSKDEVARQIANARKIKRYLENEPDADFDSIAMVNLLPSVLAAMPAHLCISFLTEYLSPLSLGVHGTEDGEGELTLTNLAAVMKEDAEAHQAMAAVLNKPCPIALTAARKEIHEAIDTKKKALRIVNAMLRAKSAAGRAINKVLHRETA